MTSKQRWTHQMSPEDKLFYKQLGQRIAQFRKAKGLTQVQLAERLKIAQQTMAHYEGGNLRIAVSLLKNLAYELDVSVEELVYEAAPAAKGKRGPTSVLQSKVDQISQLPRAKQKFVIEMLDTVINQQTAR